MIPDGVEFKARLVEVAYQNGEIVSIYRVFVPDQTISGDYRHEYVEVRESAMLQSNPTQEATK